MTASERVHIVHKFLRIALASLLDTVDREVYIYSVGIMYCTKF